MTLKEMGTHLGLAPPQTKALFDKVPPHGPLASVLPSQTGMLCECC